MIFVLVLLIVLMQFMPQNQQLKINATISENAPVKVLRKYFFTPAFIASRHYIKTLTVSHLISSENSKTDLFTKFYSNYLEGNS